MVNAITVATEHFAQHKIFRSLSIIQSEILLFWWQVIFCLCYENVATRGMVALLSSSQFDISL